MQDQDTVSAKVLRQYIDRALSWTKTIMNSDGGLPAAKPGDLSSPWITSGIGMASLLCGEDPSADYMPKMLEYVIAAQHRDGGYSVVPKSASASDPTSSVVMLMCYAAQHGSPLPENSTQCVERGVEFLLDHQLADSSWPFYAGEAIGSTISTAWTIRGLVRYLCYETTSDLVEPSRESIRRGLSYLVSNVRRTVDRGRIVNGWGRERGDDPNPSCTAWATIALTEALNVVSDRRVPEMIELATAFLLSSQREDGTWDDVPEHHRDFTFIRLSTPYVLIALLLQQANLKKRAVKSATKWVLESFHADGYVPYRQSDIVAWPTRDSLTALAYLLRVTERCSLEGGLW